MLIAFLRFVDESAARGEQASARSFALSKEGAMFKIDARNVVVGLVLLLAGVFLLHDSFVTKEVFESQPGELGYMTYPRAILYGWIAVSVILIFSRSGVYDLRELRKSLPDLSKAACSLAVYAVLFLYTGVLVGTFVFLVLFLWLMKFGRPRAALVFSVLVSLATWLVFEKLLGVIFPTPFWM